MSLKPVKGRKLNLERIFVGDIEAENWVQNFVLGGYYDGSNYYLFDKIDDMIEFILSKEKKNPVVYFHNLSYDCLFILEYLIKKNYDFRIVKAGSYVYQIKVRRSFKSKNCVYFRDSYVLLRSSLNEASKIFLNDTKEEFDYDKDFLNREKLESYLKKDLYLLYNVLIKFFEAVDFVNSISLSSLSLIKFRQSLSSEIYYKVNNSLDAYGRNFYFGGRCEIFKFYGKNINVYDFNSMYPFVMSNFEYPYGKSYFVYKRNYHRIGFYKVRLKFRYDDYITPLVIKGSKLYFVNNDVFDNVYFLNSYELDLLEEEGYYNYEIIEGIEFEKKGFIFKDYINDLYNKRIEAKKSNNRVLDYVMKLMLNSLYGKFGQTRVKKTYITEYQVDYLYNRIRSIEDKEKREKMLIELRNKLTYLGNNIYSYEVGLNFAEYLNVFISALTTSLARIHLYKFLKKYQENIYYCDTDSIFVDCEISKEYVDNFALGKLKFEKKFSQVYFLLPKFYSYVDSGGNKGSVAKGFKRFVDIDEIFNFLSGGILKDEYIEPASFLESLRNISYIKEKYSATRAIKKIEKYIRSLYDKRKIVNDNDTYPFGYSEIII
ncbi:MAG: DNA polymerase [Elusimicrobiota bacterium]|nr:DNA polymerase [Endomicrobiia bacterium]MDW8166044.1 DNA polymerase [Elusimicrobiota bacterium]